VQFRILGPLEVGNGPRGVAVETPKLRVLLGVLLLHPNEVVSGARLIDELWGECPPATASKLVQTYVSQLRRELGPETIETRAPGYLLPVGDDDLDAVRFRRLTAEGRRLAAGHDLEGACRVYRQALALWRGPPLAGVLFESFARNEVDQLEEERLSSMMELTDCELALARHTEVVPELETLVRQYPLRERLRAQLMLALYRSGRQADALAVYRDAHRSLVEQLGLEPGPELQQLEKQVLTHDPALVAPPGGPTGNGQSVARRLTGRRAAVVVGAVWLAVSVLLVVVLTDHGQTSIRLAPNRVGFIAAKSDRVTKSFPVGREPRALALGFGSVWVADYRDTTVTRIDRRTGNAVTIPVGGHPTGIATAGGGVWVWTLEGLLVRIDPRFDEPASPIRLPAQNEHVGVSSGGIAAGGGFLWVAAPPTTGIRVESANPRRHVPIDLPAGAAGPIAYWDDRAWVAGSGQVIAVDAQTMAAEPGISVGDARGLAFANGALWVVSGGPGHVGGVVEALRRVNVESGLIDYQFGVGGDPAAVTAAAGSIWAASRSDGTVSRVDPRRNQVIDTISLGASPTALAADADGVWVAVQ
jgi:DNA-binding SARP family transcriptional activator/streptogramin lyase